jgi:hypothetical protein
MTKHIMHHCAYCRTETKMEFVGGQPSEPSEESNKVWYRCTRCKHSALLTLAMAKSKPDISQKRISIVFDPTSISASEIIDIMTALSELYRQVGGDGLIIERGQSFNVHVPYLNGVIA